VQGAELLYRRLEEAREQARALGRRVAETALRLASEP
jgi:hypothetical protein